MIITFKNEGDEVAKTCQSARETAGDKIDIIVLNDASDDGFDYEESLKPYNVEYHYSSERLGTSRGREKCLEYCKTPYFIIMDGHCRFMTEDWCDKAIAVMDKGEDCVYCCACSYFSDEGITSTKGLGAYYDYSANQPLNCIWNIKKLSDEEFEVPCIFGANYLCSMEWWKKIDGLKGLKLYGRDEPFLSRKSIMMGGKVKLIPQIWTLHKTRKNGFPYKVNWSECIYNDLAMIYILWPEMFNRVVKYFKKKYGQNTITTVLKDIIKDMNYLYGLQQYIAKNKKHDYEYVDRQNNEFIKKMQDFQG